MKNFLKKIGAFFKRELKTLIISIVISIIIWFAVSIQVFPDESDHVDGIPVIAEPTLFMQQENLMITDFNEEVSIQIQGKRYVIGTLTPDDFIASLDLSGISSPGVHNVNVDLSMVHPTSDCEIITRGLTVSVNIQRIVTKEIALEVNTGNISVADSLQIQTDEISLSTETVRISGEESLVNSVARAVIDPVSSSVLTETTRLSGNVTLYDSGGTKIDDPGLEYAAGNYSVTIPLYRVKTLPLNVSIIYPQNFNQNSLKYTIYPQEITIAAPATDMSIENLDRIDVGQINLTNVTNNDLQGSVRLTISLGEGYKNLSNIAVAQISFENVDDYERRTFSVSTENFTFLNGDPNYDYSFITSRLDVTAVGPYELLNSLTSDDITGTVNLLGTPTDESVKNLTVTLRIARQGLTTGWINGDYTVDVRITKKSENEEQ